MKLPLLYSILLVNFWISSNKCMDMETCSLYSSNVIPNPDEMLTAALSNFELFEDDKNILSEEQFFWLVKHKATMKENIVDSFLTKSEDNALEGYYGYYGQVAKQEHTNNRVVITKDHNKIKVWIRSFPSICIQEIEIPGLRQHNIPISKLLNG